MDKLNFTVIDFETANSSRNSICQIGICKVESGNIIYSESYFVQPPDNEFSHWNIGIHGISPDVTQNKPFFSEIWGEIKLHIENQLIVAHNAEFDIDCLFKTLEYYNLSIPSIEIECTYKISGLNLIDLAESLDIELSRHHDALNDTRMCAESYIKLKLGHLPNLDKITIKEKKSLFAGHEKLTGDVLTPNLDQADPTSIFYNRKVVFTGILSKIEREQAAEIVKRMGADIDSGITKRTDFVIIGSGAGPSKLKKISEFNESGSKIRMVYESEFLELIHSSR